MADMRDKLTRTRRCVVKLGSSLLTNNGCGLRDESLQIWVNQVMQLRQSGIVVVIVSSGATAEGVSRLGWKNPGLSTNYRRQRPWARWGLSRHTNPVSRNLMSERPRYC